MKIKESLPIKYHIGAYRMCATYPDETDVLFDIVSHVMSSNKRRKKFDVGDFKISSAEVKDAICNMSDLSIKERAAKALLELKQRGHVSIMQPDGIVSDQLVISVTPEGFYSIYER